MSHVSASSALTGTTTVSGGGALLSYWAGKRWAEPVAGLGTARTVVAVALALPLFLYGVLRFPLI